MIERDLAPYLARRRRPADQPVVMWQKWRALLFLHWTYEPDVIQATLPAGLTVDTFEGRAYIGVVPFFMRDIRPRWVPPVPGISNFLETNVRTYVRDGAGRPGVWFYSLDANRRLAVWIARLTFRLPYHYAKMRASGRDLGAGIDYELQRQGGERPSSRFSYRAAGQPQEAEPGSFLFFLVERYLLFAATGPSRLAAGQVHHTPYPIVPATAAAWDSRLITAAGLPDPGRPPDHIAASPGVDVAVYPLRRIPA